MILLQNKKTKAEYYVTDEEMADIKKGGHLIKFNILNKTAETSEKKSNTTVEVIDFIKSKQTHPEPVKEEIVDKEPDVITRKRNIPKQTKTK